MNNELSTFIIIKRDVKGVIVGKQVCAYVEIANNVYVVRHDYDENVSDADAEILLKEKTVSYKPKISNINLR